MLEIKEIKNHACTREEIGLSGSDPKFWPINESQVNALDAFHSLYRCADDLSNFRLYGNIKTEKARMLQVDVVKCTGKDYCKSDEEIREYFAN